MKNRLEALKKALHLEWGELAVELGISRSMLNQVRNGKKEFGPKIVRAVIELEIKAGLAAAPEDTGPPERTVRESTADAMPDHRDLSKKLDEILRRLDNLEKRYR